MVLLMYRSIINKLLRYYNDTMESRDARMGNCVLIVHVCCTILWDKSYEDHALIMKTTRCLARLII